MKNTHLVKGLYSLGLLLLASLAISFTSSVPLALISVDITDGSKLFLEGTTNVNTFVCHCNQAFPNQTINLVAGEDRSKVFFKNTSLQIATRELDCGIKGINRDLQKTLQADAYPNINITLLETSLAAHRSVPDAPAWSDLKVKTSIAIAGTTRNIVLDVKAQKVAADLYRFVSTYTVRMQDFNIEPPTAMMGLIKVDDCIDINFDLEVLVFDQ